MLSASPTFSQHSAADVPQIQAADIDPARLDAARGFVQAAQFEKQSAHGVSGLINRLSSQIMPILTSALPPEKRTAETPKLFEESSVEIEKVVANKFRQWIDRVTMAYARAMSTEQLTAISEFYRSSLGQKFMRASPVNVEGMGFLILDWLTGKPAQLPGNTDPTAIDAAREAIRMSKSDKLLDEFLVLMSGPPDGIELRGDPKWIDTIRTNLTRRNEMLEFIAAVWARRFTIEEMQTITAFYRTPIAASVAEVMPTITREQTKITTAFYKECSADLSAWTDDMLKKLDSQP
jgi:hypothetical protein